jgi:hypothetical protein
LTIPAAGPVTALTWALEIGEVKRFGNCKQAVSCCGLCGSENSSAGRQKRMPISKQRNSSSADGVDRSGEAGPALRQRTGSAACHRAGERKPEPGHAGGGAETGGMAVGGGPAPGGFPEGNRNRQGRLSGCPLKQRGIHEAIETRKSDRHCGGNSLRRKEFDLPFPVSPPGKAGGAGSPTPRTLPASQPRRHAS